MPDKIGHRLPGGEKAVSWQEAPNDGKGKSDTSPGKMLLAKIKKKILWIVTVRSQVIYGQ